MIFVTVGTRKEGFDRLVRWMDDLSTEIGEEVVMQIGHTEDEPDNAEWFRFKDDLQDIVELTREASLVVGHGGAGTIITTLETGTPIICVPRLQEHNENFDDHQLELTSRLESQGSIMVAHTKEELRDYLLGPTEDVGLDPEPDIVPAFRDHLQQLEKRL